MSRAHGDAASHPHGVSLSFTYDDERTARTIAESVVREVEALADDRSRTAVEHDERTVTVDVRASDLTALRAASNTWFSLVDVAERTIAVATRATDSSTRAADDESH